MGRRKDAPLDHARTKGAGPFKIRNDSGSLKAEHMASNREQVVTNRLCYLLLFSVPWGFQGAVPWLDNGNCYVARFS